MRTRFLIHQAPAVPVDAQPLEIVERKGKGHPDTICDAIAEAVSIQLSKAYQDTFGHILHHNIDKCLLVAGQVVTLFQFSLFTLFRGSRHLLEEFGFVDVQPVIMSLALFMMVLGPIDSFIGWLFKLLSRRCCGPPPPSPPHLATRLSKPESLGRSNDVLRTLLEYVYELRCVCQRRKSSIYSLTC